MEHEDDPAEVTVRGNEVSSTEWGGGCGGDPEALRRVILASREVGPLVKDPKGGQHGPAVTNEQAMELVRPLLAAHNLYLSCNILEVHRHELEKLDKDTGKEVYAYPVSALVRIRWHLAEAPDRFYWIDTWIQEICHAEQYPLAKIETAAYKRAVLRCLLVPTEEPEGRDVSRPQQFRGAGGGSPRPQGKRPTEFPLPTAEDYAGWRWEGPAGGGQNELLAGKLEAIAAAAEKHLGPTWKDSLSGIVEQHFGVVRGNDESGVDHLVRGVPWHAYEHLLALIGHHGIDGAGEESQEEQEQTEPRDPSDYDEIPF